jgi:hypothetical protein
MFHVQRGPILSGIDSPCPEVSYSAGTSRMKFTAGAPPNMPRMCLPFDFDSGFFAVPTDPAVCEADGLIPFADFGTTFEPFRCGTDNVALTIDEDINRKRCTIAGKPMFQQEFDDVSRNVEAVTVRFLYFPPPC